MAQLQLQLQLQGSGVTLTPEQLRNAEHAYARFLEQVG